MSDTRLHLPAADISSVRINPDEWNEIYVVGDVHGCRETLDRLLAQIDPGNEDLIVFVGDLVRKGPDSKGVVDTVRDRENFLSVRGNNEQKIIDRRDDIPDLTTEDISFLESMPVLIAWGNSLVAHGGVDPRKPLSEHSETELLTMRSLVSRGSYDRPYWFETRRESPRVFFGHTVLSEPFATDWAVGLDTGCVHGGQLTAYRCSTDEFLTADPRTTHLERSPNSIVDPELCDPVP